MSTPQDAASFLMGSGGPAAKFPDLGTTVGGPITRIGAPMQQRDMATNAPKFWDDGNPMMQLPVDVQTDQRDTEIPNDDGVRTLYIKGQMQAAIRDAVRRSGARMLEVGGTLTVKYASDGQPAKKGFNAPKVYEATYTPPTAAAAAQFFDSDTPETTTAAPAAPPVAGLAPGTQITPEVAALLAQLQAQQPATSG